MHDVAKMNTTRWSTDTRTGNSGPTLPLSALDGGLRHLQSANTLRQSAFVQRLRTGASISIGVLGASVAQQGGCLDQPGERCMLYSRKGYFVRLLRYINATWPHPSNALHNGAIDATPAQSFMTCLMPLLPVAPPQLLLLEFGSMARSIDLPRTELLIRRLLALPSQPLLLFVTVREWCASSHIWFNSKRNVSAKTLFSKHTYAQGADTLYAKAEATFERFCLHYDLSCVSYHGALARGFYGGWPGFELAAIAADCLHPAKGRHGGAYMTQLLEHWTRRVMAAADSTVTSMSASPMGARERAAALSLRIMPTEPPTAHLAPRALPAPLLPEARRALRMPRAEIEPDRCWGFGPLGAHGKHYRYARLQLVPWRTAYCATADLPFERCEFRCDRASCAQLCPAVHPGRPSYLAAAAVPPTVSTATAPHSTSALSLPVWTHCLYALGQSSVRGRRPKRSEGALALRPGASIEVPLDISRAHAATGAVACAELSYLTSYEHMGVASVSCVRGCACDSRRIDAHRPPDAHERNVSLFSQLRLTLRLSRRGRTPPMPPQSTTTTEEEEEEEAVREVDTVCWLRVRVLDDSSSGGGHKFKLRLATVAVGAACAEGEQSSRSTVRS